VQVINHKKSSHKCTVIYTSLSLSDPSSPQGGGSSTNHQPLSHWCKLNVLKLVSEETLSKTSTLKKATNNELDEAVFHALVNMPKKFPLVDLFYIEG